MLQWPFMRHEWSVCVESRTSSLLKYLMSFGKAFASCYLCVNITNLVNRNEAVQ